MIAHKELTEEEWKKLRTEAELKLGRPFVTRLPVKRVTDKSDLLRKFEGLQKEEARRRPVVTNIKEKKNK